MAIQFKKATKKESRLRLGIVGPSGSGKTYTALKVATGLGGKIVVMDSEHGSASKYADEFEFDVFEPDSFSPKVYVEFLKEAAEAGYQIAILDSLSHAWMGKDGALEMVDRAASRNSGNSFAGWRDVTPLHNQMIEAILAAPVHVIATMRSKTEYVIEEDHRGKKVPRKIGMQPVQRDGMEYEFDVVGDIDHDHKFVITKTRCRTLKDAVIPEPGAEFAETLSAWLSDGEPLASVEQLGELRRMALAISERAGWSMDQKIARGVTVSQADEWIEAMRQPASGQTNPTLSGSSESSPPPETPTSAASAPTTTTETATAENVPISEPQMRRFFALSKTAGYTEDGTRRMLVDRFDIDTPKGLHRGIYEEACDAASSRDLADQYNQDPNQAELLEPASA